MPTTRSATKQTRIDDFPTEKKVNRSAAKAKTKKVTKTSEELAPKSEGADSKASKRTKSTDSVSISLPVSKKSKKTASSDQQQHFASNNATELEKPIIINRSPVLQLWGACVAKYLHSDLSWTACLSVGNVISSLCAVSKGRSIGMIEPPDEAKAEERQSQKQAAKNRAKPIDVMGFPLYLQGDDALLSGKPKKLNENNLIGKFGGENQYEKAKTTMTDALTSWKGEEEELDKKAFHMYEKFRPNVATGQQGWGRKGELNLHEVTSVIKR